jgi:serine protease inhibitor
MAVAALAATAPIAVVTACGGAAPGGTGAAQASGPAIVRGVAAVEPAVSAAPLAAADLGFGLRLLDAACAQQPGANIVLSPASLASGLGMAYLGARGATAAAMAGTLDLPAGTGSLAADLQARARALRGLDGPGVTVYDSDEVWANPSLRPLTSYLDAVATGYDAGVGRVPLLTDPAQAAADIDAAVAAGTGGHIAHLLTASDLQDVIFVLTDAMYLSARWAAPFQSAQNSAGPFRTAAGSVVSANYLNGSGFAASTAGGWTAVSLPYRGDRLAMTALLPPAGASGCHGLTTGLVRSLTESLAKAPGGARVALPKVDLSTSVQLNGLLSELGMRVAFTPRADFLGMSPQAGQLGEVVHAATLRVNDGGTVASAATAVTVLPLALEVGPTVSFDRPYLMLISDTSTGEPLFLARVANPDLP